MIALRVRDRHELRDILRATIRGQGALSARGAPCALLVLGPRLLN